MEGRIDVSLNGQPFTQLFHNDPLATLDDLHWAAFAYWFRATASTTTLTLSDVTKSEGLSGSLLDGLSVTAGPILILPLTPTPPTGLETLKIFSPNLSGSQKSKRATLPHLSGDSRVGVSLTGCHSADNRGVPDRFSRCC